VPVACEIAVVPVNEVAARNDAAAQIGMLVVDSGVDDRDSDGGAFREAMGLRHVQLP